MTPRCGKSSYASLQLVVLPDPRQNNNNTESKEDMSVSSYDAVIEKVLFDLESAIRKDPSINEFYIIPTLEEDNKNRSPIVKGENTLGLESWMTTHIYPFAHHQIMMKNNFKSQNLSKVIPCLTGVALLNPEMPTVWNKRKELIIAKKMGPDLELRLTRMALSRKPKCNDVLAHRRWIILEFFKDVDDQLSVLNEELSLCEMIADRYHSNYHAWSHRMWVLQNLLPDSQFLSFKKKSCQLSFFRCLQTAPLHENNIKFDKEGLSVLNHSQICEIYFKELDDNFKWISCHVSDHSGLHFRTFLLSEILLFMKNSILSTDRSIYPPDHNENVSNAIFANVLTSGKINLIEFFNSHNMNDDHKETIKKYLNKLDEEEITLLDVTLLLITTELKLNCSLCLMFPHHETLWSYRRFLIHSFCAVARALDSSLPLGKIFVHQDKNGVPCRKDFKLDDDNARDGGVKHSTLVSAFFSNLTRSEEEFILKSDSSSSDEFHFVLTRTYRHWYKKCLSENDFSF